MACPAGMTRIDWSLCIDSYEASRNGSAARSAAGVMPWVDRTLEYSAVGFRCCLTHP